MNTSMCSISLDIRKAKGFSNRQAPGYTNVHSGPVMLHTFLPSKESTSPEIMNRGKLSCMETERRQDLVGFTLIYVSNQVLHWVKTYSRREQYSSPPAASQQNLCFTCLLQGFTARQAPGSTRRLHCDGVNSIVSTSKNRKN